jgi:hypothetical protein
VEVQMPGFSQHLVRFAGLVVVGAAVGQFAAQTGPTSRGAPDATSLPRAQVAAALRPSITAGDAAVIRGSVVSVDQKTRTATLANGLTYTVPGDLPLPLLHEDIAITVPGGPWH